MCWTPVLFDQWNMNYETQSKPRITKCCIFLSSITGQAMPTWKQFICQTTVHYIHITCVACLLRHRCPQTHYRQLMDSVQLKMHTSDKQCWLLLQATGKLQKVNAPYICALHMGHQWKMVQFMSWCYSPMVTGQWLHLATYTDLCPCGET